MKANEIFKCFQVYFLAGAAGGRVRFSADGRKLSCAALHSRQARNPIDRKQ